jgi:hypothetical protein
LIAGVVNSLSKQFNFRVLSGQCSSILAWTREVKVSTMELESEQSRRDSQFSTWIQFAMFCLASVVRGLEDLMMADRFGGLEESLLGVACTIL